MHICLRNERVYIRLSSLPVLVPVRGAIEELHVDNGQQKESLAPCVSILNILQDVASLGRCISLFALIQ